MCTISSSYTSFFGIGMFMIVGDAVDSQLQFYPPANPPANPPVNPPAGPIPFPEAIPPNEFLAIFLAISPKNTDLFFLLILLDFLFFQLDLFFLFF
jgi:hypothetical protein